MGWKVIRVDFTGKPSVDCAFSQGQGHKKLTNGIAYVVVDALGNERFAGPTCVKKVDNPEDIRLVPDYTKGCFLQGEPRGSSKHVRTQQTGSQNSTSKSPTDESDLERAVKYLTLRCELLAGYKKATWPQMSKALEKYRQTNELTQADIRKALVAANGSHPDYAHLSMARLLPFYTVYRLLQSLDNAKIEKVASDKNKRDALFVELYKDTFLSKDSLDTLNQLLDTYGFKKLRVRRNLFRLAD
ncbi:hypothetical protein K6U44_04210 [Vibrio parahaemolyticus]|uniref:hypothetical protein n=1 Tax=Vibrio parahaemolyticus TaxID=670 RepID=UPI001EEA4258|nr:hypothetical protein [Vibrio parahaemolyticus]MCG6459663.1 hypothetical protein [Vibrio parahaemolyticus]